MSFSLFHQAMIDDAAPNRDTPAPQEIIDIHARVFEGHISWVRDKPASRPYD